MRIIETHMELCSKMRDFHVFFESLISEILITELPISDFLDN